jgi:cell shape-determining protein MreD
LFPFVVYLAAVTSVVLLVALYWSGDLPTRTGAFLAVIFGVATYWQFFGPSAVIAALGLGVQTMLAIYLLVRWRLSA